MICEKCGTEMEKIKTDFSIGVECPNCGWGWVTTSVDSIKEDNTSYEIWLEPGNVQSASNIKLIATVAGINVVQAKKILNSDGAELIYKSQLEPVSKFSAAQHVQKNAKMLKKAGIEFRISPNFPYEI